MNPLHDNVVVRKIERDTITAGGLYVPQTASEGSFFRGEVIKTGPGRRDRNGNRVPVDVSVGDTVFLSSHAATEFVFGDQKFFMVTESNILLVIEEENE